MAKRRITIGTGILSRAAEYDDQPDQSAVEWLAETFGTQRPTFKRKVAKLADNCRWIVENPQTFVDEAKKLGTFDDRGRTWKDDLPPALAEEILNYIRKVHGQVEKGNAEMAARLAFDLGVKACELAMKIGREADYLHGVSRLKGARLAHEKLYGTKEEKVARWQRLYDDLLAELAKGTKKTAAYALVAERHGVSPKQVQRAPRYLGKS